MSDAVRVVRVGHSLHVVEDLQAARRRYLGVFGAWLFAELELESAGWENNLMYLGDHMLETMSPLDRHRPTDLVRFLDTRGEGYHFIHLMVESLAPVREMLARFDLEPVGLDEWDGVLYVFDAEAARGLTLEASLPALPGSSDPQVHCAGWRPDWAKGQPSSFEGLACLNLALREMEWPRRFLTEGWGGRVIAEDSVDAPEPLDRCFIALGDQVFCLCVPRSGSAGPIGRYLEERGPGTYSLTWKVGGLNAFRGHLDRSREMGVLEAPVRLRSDLCATGEFAIDPDDFFGARHEFTERSFD